MKRSYEINTVAGGIIFKCMEPADMQRISSNPDIRKRLGWASIQMVGNDNVHLSADPKPRVQRDRPDFGFLTSYNRGMDPRRR